LSMRFLLMLTAITGFTARAETQTFTSDFASRLSFFSTRPGVAFGVALNESGVHCVSPCTLAARAGETSFSVTRDGFTKTETHVLSPGENYVAIRPYSVPLIVAGSILMSVSATSLMVAAIFIALVPMWGPLVLGVLFAPLAVVTGVPGVVFTALAPRRQTLQVYRGELQVP
jgi:hypothetical protein